MKGLVIRTTSNAYSVLAEDGEVVTAHIKGNIRLRGIRSTNPVAVGDEVMIEASASASGSTTTGSSYWITDICSRRNYIVRKSTNLSKESHILASNIDQVALIVTLTHPQTSLTFVDRFLATAEAYRVRAFLIFNKVDLLENGVENTELRELRDLYESLGYPTVALCAKDASTLPADLYEAFRGQTTLLSGNSGVGKSTLLNTLLGEERARTAEISDSHLQGMHTTTFSEMYFLPDARVIDTPGIRGFGTFDFQRTEVGHFFREIFQASSECKYSDCLHLQGVPGCAVLPKVVDGSIAISRYQSYLSMLDDQQENKYR